MFNKSIRSPRPVGMKLIENKFVKPSEEATYGCKLQPDDEFRKLIDWAVENLGATKQELLYGCLERALRDVIRDLIKRREGAQKEFLAGRIKFPEGVSDERLVISDPAKPPVKKRQPPSPQKKSSVTGG